MFRAVAKPFRAWWKHFNCPHTRKARVCGFYFAEDIAAHGGRRSKWQCENEHCGDVLYSWDDRFYVPVDVNGRKA